jgi:hypothetical protein
MSLRCVRLLVRCVKAEIHASYNDDLNPSDQAERLERVEITHDDLLSAFLAHRGSNIQY